ncbi:kunitz-type serine protease inhibitor scutellin-4-like [Drosophila subpulchrella]|uniref:kunitz-type serine protease inhibitor scutellin-4-like n=1 Tax=Drosophila subpulchrella TaxID=1486046 RepID=UPI0018A15B4B|nr:kunitz-type serine protease inhibitor scutellin-4-like [Drosophila subpulchrella]
MKFILILVSLVLYISLVAAQTCPGRPNPQNCNGGRDEGSPTQAPRGAPCTPQPNNNMWYYNPTTRQCVGMSYRGCYGNRNRYCTLQTCQVACVPRG